MMKTTKGVDSDSEIKKANGTAFGALFDTWDGRVFEPTDFMIDVRINSVESKSVSKKPAEKIAKYSERADTTLTTKASVFRLNGRPM